MAGFQLDPKLKILFVAVLGLSLALTLGYSVGQSNYTPVVIGLLALVLFVIWFGTGEYFWIFTIASSFLGGTFPILGGQFNSTLR